MFSARFRFHTDPSGTYVKYEAKAIGSGSEGAQTNLQDQYNKVSQVSGRTALLHSRSVGMP